MIGIVRKNPGPPWRVYVLSLWRPWPATFFQPIAKPKRIENRQKPPPRAAIGTWVAFHAGQQFDYDRFPLIAANAPEVSPDPHDHPAGLIGMAFISGVATSIDEVPDDQRCWWLGPVAYLTPHVVAFDAEFQRQLWVPDRKGVVGPVKGQQGWKFLRDEHVELIAARYGEQMGDLTHSLDGRRKP